MRISFDKKILIENNEAFKNFAKQLTDKFATNKKEFNYQLMNLFKGGEIINPDAYYLFKYQIGNKDKEILIPIYRIQNFTYFIESDTIWSEAEFFKIKLNDLSKWANNLNYTKYFNIDAPVDWESTIIEMFGPEKLNAKALSDFINRIYDTISRLDKWLRDKLLNINSPLDVLKLVTESIQINDRVGYFDLYPSLDFYSKKAIKRLDLFGYKALKKYVKFWNFVFDLETWNGYGMDLTTRPIYYQRIKPAIDKIREKSKIEINPKAQFENKMYIFPLSNLTNDNVEQIFNKIYFRWRYLNSHEVIVNGEKVESTIERELLMLPDRNGNPNIKDCTLSDTTKNGFPLTIDTFINEELSKYEPLYKKSVGSNVNRENNLKLKVYLDYLYKLEAIPTQQLQNELSIELISIHKAFQPPDARKEFEKLLNQIRDGNNKLQQYQIIISEIIPRWEREIKETHTYPEYYNKMLALFKDEADVIKKCLDVQKEYDPVIQTQQKEEKPVLIRKSEILTASERTNLLQDIKVGNKYAKKFHEISYNNLIYIFGERLSNPVIEKEINEGRKRIDVVFDNNDKKGFFHKLNTLHKIQCPKIFVECKNYGNEIGNPEIDQLQTRFNDKRGRFGILLCRSIKNKKALIQRCIDVLNDSKSYIIVLDDKDIVDLLNFREANDEVRIDDLMTKKLDELIM